MIKIVSFGDRLFHSPSGYGSLLHPQLICADPSAPLDIHSFSSEGLTYGDVLGQIPMHVIGKAPNQVFLGLGYHDISKLSVEAIEETLSSVISLIKDKTQSEILLANLCTVFFEGDENIQRKCIDYNQICAELCEKFGLHLVDFDTETSEFLKVHISGEGQKLSLHTEGPNLTVIGALFLSRIASNRIFEVLGI